MDRPALYYELAPFYDRIYAAKDYLGESEEVVERARRLLGHRPSSLLDIACGTGRHLAAFRRRVPRVAGVDASPAMLAIARRRLGPRVVLRRGDLRSFRVPGPFEVAVCLFSSIGYLTRPGERDAALARIYDHLVPGGVAFVEGWVLPERWLGGQSSLLTYDGPDAKVARLTRSRRRGSLTTLEMHYLVGEPGRPVRYRVERHRNRLVPARDMLASFERAGFRARVIRSGRYRDRGLYVGIRPKAPRAGKPS